MSKQDKDIVEKLGLPVARLASFLNITRQSVTQGLNKTDNYLDNGRLLRIYNQLRTKDQEKANKLKKIAIEYYPDKKNIFEQQDVKVIPNSPTESNFKELWVFSKEPYELQDQMYLKQMADLHYHDKEKTIIYFINPGKAELLANTLRSTFTAFKHKSINDYARVFVLESTAIYLSPHFIIEEPKGDTAGYVLTENGQFAKISIEESNAIVSYIISAGIGLNDDDYMPNYLFDDDGNMVNSNGLTYRLLFSSINSTERGK